MSTKVTAIRYHDISCGHTVMGHEGKCKNLHGHNYRIWFQLESSTGPDKVGRVVDFGVIKSLFCQWLEDNWDHKFLVFQDDPRNIDLAQIDPTVVVVPFNPTAENMAVYLLKVVCPFLLGGMEHLVVTKITVEETRKCKATAEWAGVP